MSFLNEYAALCEWAPTGWLIISENVFDPLIYYSHLVPVLLSLPLALFVLMSDHRRRLHQYFFLTVALFSLWSIGDLILWAHADPKIIMAIWSLLILLEPLVYVAGLLFAYEALFEKPLPGWTFYGISILILPIILFLPTQLAIESFNLTNCWREVTEGPLVFYGYIVQIIIVFAVVGFATQKIFRSKTTADRNQSFLTAAAVLLFLAVFSSGNILGSLFEDWTLGQYGLFGMPLMSAVLTFLISRYRIFNTKVLTAQIVVAALFVLTLGLLFIENVQTVRAVALVTLVLIVLLGGVLVRSVRQEVQQRREIEQLAQKLEKANKRLKILDQMKSEFVSIASHQLRSPLTSIRGYASMLLEGSYGKLTTKAEEAVQRISEASRLMALSVEDYLNVSRIQAGNMKYVYSDFNLVDMASHIVDDVRREALKKGLVLSFKSDMSKQGIVHADNGKTVQIIHNLINNALKYTLKGTITVFVHDQKKQIFVDIVDTGIGMSQESIDSIFDKFERAHNANEVNVTGTGLGLYVAQKMAQEMGGDIEAFSDGEGKGSTFRLTLPLMM